jgi:hypothetical protein
MRGQMSHPDSEVLAEHQAGLISGRRGAKVAAHLATCDRCTAVSDQLAGISVLLASAPAPAVPDGVAQRLDTVLAAEAARRSDSERAGADRSRERAAEPRRNRRGFRFLAPRVLAPAAAVVALAAAGFGLSHLGGLANSRAASSAAGPPAATPAASSGAKFAKTAAVPANAAPAHSGAAPLYGAARGAALGLPPHFTVISSDTNYLRATLRPQLEAALQAALPTPKALGVSLSPSAQIRACVSRVTSGTSPGTPLLVETARYQGQPAIVIIASGQGGDPAWITGPGCSGTSSNILVMTVLPPGISAP